jgi:hypothetical protein
MMHSRLLSTLLVLGLTVPVSTGAFTVETFKKKMTSSAASSIETRNLATRASFNRQNGRDIANISAYSMQIFVPFLKRFITLPAGWSGVVKKEGEIDVVVFTRAATEKVPVGTLKVRLFDYKQCDKNNIEKSQKALWAAANKPVEGKIDIARAYGAAGLGLTWLEPGTDGNIRQYCIVPAGNILTAQVTINASEIETAQVVERHLLAQLWRYDRFGRRR